MKYLTLLLLLGVVSASQDPYECVKEIPCNKNMECLRRTIVEVKAETAEYQAAALDDPDLKLGKTSYWCIPKEWVKPALKMNNKLDGTNMTIAEFEKIDKPKNYKPKDDKAYIAGIECDANLGICPYEGMVCVSRLIQKADQDSTQYQKMLQVDPSYAVGQKSHWCVTESIYETGLQWNGEFNKAWGLQMEIKLIEEKSFEQPERETRDTVAAEKKKGKGPKPGGSWTDNIGNTVEWGDEGMSMTQEELGVKVMVVDNEQGGQSLRLKMMGATGLTTGAVLGAVTVMQSLY